MSDLVWSIEDENDTRWVVRPSRNNYWIDLVVTKPGGAVSGVDEAYWLPATVAHAMWHILSEETPSPWSYKDRTEVAWTAVRWPEGDNILLAVVNGKKHSGSYIVPGEVVEFLYQMTPEPEGFTWDYQNHKMAL